MKTELREFADRICGGEGSNHITTALHHLQLATDALNRAREATNDANLETANVRLFEARRSLMNTKLAIPQTSYFKEAEDAAN